MVANRGAYNYADAERLATGADERARRALAMQAATRARQSDLAGLYEAAALGQGPSGADAAAQAARDQAFSEGLALARGAPGAFSAGQQHAAIGAERAAADAAAMRASEIARARQGWAGTLGSMRGSDLARQEAAARQADTIRRAQVNAEMGVATNTSQQQIASQAMSTADQLALLQGGTAVGAAYLRSQSGTDEDENQGLVSDERRKRMVSAARIAEAHRARGGY